MQAEIFRQNLEEEFYTEEQCYITELSQDWGLGSSSIARARVKPGVTTNWHILKETTERYHILQGKGRVEVGDLEAEDIGVGDTVVIPPECPQRISNIGEEDLIFLAICTPPFDEYNYEDIEDLKTGKLVTVNFIDFESAYEYVEAARQVSTSQAVIHKKTGEIFTKTDYDSGIEDVFPSDEELDEYTELPSKRELDLGTNLVDSFVNTVIPSHRLKVQKIFSRRGAYRRYKDYLDGIDKLEDWYDFEDESKKNALKEWARKAGFELVK